MRADDRQRPSRFLQQRPDAVLAEGSPDVVILDFVIARAAVASAGIMSVVILADTFAYVFGTLIGGPRILPGRSVNGPRALRGWLPLGASHRRPPTAPRWKIC